MTTPLTKSQVNNLRFLIVEVGVQISNLQDYLANEAKGLSSGSFDRSGYIHNLKIRIHHDGYQQMLKGGNNESELVAIRSIDNIANNLERIAELCLDCTYHVADLSNKNALGRDDTGSCCIGY